MTQRRTILAVAGATLAGLRSGLAQGVAPGVVSGVASGVAPMVEHPYARANYIPGAPMRARVGSGKVIRGRVVAAGSGTPVAGATVEYYLNTTRDAGGIGEQNPVNRGQVVADAEGRFAFECDPPQTVGYGAAPHVHTRATADGRTPFFYRHLTPSDPSVDDVTIVLVGA